MKSVKNGAILIKISNTKNIHTNDHGEENNEKSKRSYKNGHKITKKIKCPICIHYYHLRIVHQLFGIKFIRNVWQQITPIAQSPDSDGINVLYDSNESATTLQLRVRNIFDDQL